MYMWGDFFLIQSLLLLSAVFFLRRGCAFLSTPMNLCFKGFALLLSVIQMFYAVNMLREAATYLRIFGIFEFDAIFACAFLLLVPLEFFAIWLLLHTPEIPPEPESGS